MQGEGDPFERFQEQLNESLRRMEEALRRLTPRPAPPNTENCRTERSYALHATREMILRAKDEGKSPVWWAATVPGAMDRADELVQLDHAMTEVLSTLGGTK